MPSPPERRPFDNLSEMPESNGVRVEGKSSVLIIERGIREVGREDRGGLKGRPEGEIGRVKAWY